jgi:chromatin structure-remodeling complex subunit RSC9
MVAKDFITNVTSVFPGAVARVVYPDDKDRTKVKYTMKGIAPRAAPVDLRGRSYVRCQWKIPVALSTEDVDMNGGASVQPPHKDCDLWFSPSNVEEMWSHIVDQHLEIPRDPDFPNSKFKDGLIKGTGRRFACLWTGCTRYPEPGIEDAFKVCMHLKVHLPDFGPGAGLRAKYTAGDGSLKRSRAETEPRIEKFYLNTQLDEKGQATGLPLAAMLVLRNMARQMLKLDEHHAAHSSRHHSGRTLTMIEKHFGAHEEKMFHVMAYNYSLRAFAPEFLHYVSRGLLDTAAVMEASTLGKKPKLEESEAV